MSNVMYMYVYMNARHLFGLLTVQLIIIINYMQIPIDHLVNYDPWMFI